MRIRPCTQADIEPAAALFREVFAELPYGENWSQGDAVDYLERLLSFGPGLCFAAAEDGLLCGCMLGHSYPWRGEDVYVIQELFVSRECRHRGVGTALVSSISETFGRSVSVSLVANQHSDAARFYEKLGLRQHPRYKFYSGRIPLLPRSDVL